MSAVLSGTTLSAELLFLTASVDLNKEFILTGEQCSGVVGFLTHILPWAEAVQDAAGLRARPIAFCLQGLIDFFQAAEEAGGIDLDYEARRQLRSTASGLYYLAKEAEGLAPFEVRFPDWRVPAEKPANDVEAAAAPAGTHVQ